MDLVEQILPHLLNGIILGLLFALIALGFTLIVGVMELINLAHGALFALGAYFAVTLLAFSAPAGQSFFSPSMLMFLAVMLMAPFLVSFVGMGMELGMRRTYGKAPLYGLLLTFGIALILEESIRIIWGPGEQVLSTPKAISGGIEIGGLIYSKYRIFAAIAAIVIIAAVWYLIERTKIGAIIKAGAFDTEMVQALGIDISRLRMFVFGLGTALAAIAGVIIAPIWGVRPHMGVDVVIPAFLIVTLGGVGSFWGSITAGMLVGLTAGLAGFIASDWSIVSIYILLIVVLTVRRRGLFGKTSRLDV